MSIVQYIGAGIRRAAVYLCAAVIIMLGMTSKVPAAASESAPDAQADVELGEIMVTAQRREERMTTVPVSVQAVDAITLQRTEYDSTIDLLKLSPSVNYLASGGPSTSSVAIRGITSLSIIGAGLQPSTATVIDEVPMSRQAEFVNDFGDIKQIEVLRGPQGTLFGKNATAGVINITHNAPSDKYEGSVTIGDTTDHEKSGQAMLNIPLSDDISTRFNAFWRSQGAVFPNIDPNALTSQAETPGGIDTYGLMGKVAFKFTDSVDLLVSADVSHMVSYNPIVLLAPDSNPALGAAQQAANTVASVNDPFINSESGAISVVDVSGVSADLTARLSDLLTLTSVTAYRVYNNDFAEDDDSGPWGAVAGIGILPNPYNYPFLTVKEPGDGLPEGPDKSHYSSEEIRITYAPHGLELTAGSFVQLFEEHKLQQVPLIIYQAATPFYDNTALNSMLKDNVYSAFVDATYHITDPIAVFGGLRYTNEQLHVDYAQVSYFTPNFNRVTLQPNHASGAFTALSSSDIKHNLSGRVGVRFSPTPDHSYYASYSTGYKGPATNMEILPGPSFSQPELAESFEIGTKHELYDHRLIMSLALYHQLTKNLQQSLLLPGGTTTELVNSGDMVSYGAEFDMEARISKNFRIDAGAAYTHANYTNLENTCYPGQTAAQGCVNGEQNIGGTQTIGSPRVGANVAGAYDVKMPEYLPFDSFVRIGYLYTGSIQYGLNADPLLRVPEHGSLEATLGLTGRSNNWNLLLYGKNLTDERYASALEASDNFIGRVFGFFPRDYKRYGGIRLTVKF